MSRARAQEDEAGPPAGGKDVVAPLQVPKHGRPTQNGGDCAQKRQCIHLVGVQGLHPQLAWEAHHLAYRWCLSASKVDLALSFRDYHL